ncbi:hypothetical protein, partial [Acinetobacter sp.]|uniref:hypothetical protein n=1 Tax=Acinetobacter sp. TaxID=472 RepID=UPI0025BB2868
QSLLEYAQGITNASRAQRDFNASIETSKASVSGQIAVMQSLVAIAKDETQSNKTRQEAINKLNAEYSVFNKELSLSNINTDKATELINKQTAALVRQAQIKGLEGLITEETQKQAKMLTGDLDDNLTTLDKIKIALAGGIGGPTLTNSTRFNAGIESLNKNLKNSKERIDIFKKGLQELLLEDAKAGTLFDDNKGGKDDNKGGKGKQSAQLQALKEELNTEFEIYKIRQERKLKNFDDDIKSDKVHYLDKLTALKNYVEASQELIDKQEAEDIRKKKEAADREIKRLNEEKAGKNPQQIARINENIKIIEENLQQDILLIQAQAADKSVELSRNAAKVKEGILADQLKRERELYEEYAKYEQDVLNKTNDRYKKALEQRQKDEEAAAKKRLELEKDLQNRKVQLAEQAEQFLFKLGEASFTRQLNALRDLQDANEAKAAREIEILTEQERQGIITKEDAANQIAIIEARARIQKEQTEKKARDIEVNKAKFQRAQQIFEIGITAIKSVAAIKAQAAILLANPLTAALAPVALAQIPFVLGGAALGIAGILANPIPRFFKGKKKNEPYKGPALINDNPDGRTLEAITREDGTIEFPEGRNVLTHVNPGDVIHPDRDAFIRDLQRTALRSVANTANGKVTELAYVSAMTNALKGELQQNNKYLKQLVNKPAGDFHLHMQNNDYFNLKVNW